MGPLVAMKGDRPSVTGLLRRRRACQEAERERELEAEGSRRSCSFGVARAGAFVRWSAWGVVVGWWAGI